MTIGRNKNDVGFGIIKFYGKKKRKIKKGKEYRLPKRATCVQVYAGNLSFGCAKNGFKNKILKTRRGIFFKKSDFATYISFPYYEVNKGGINYGTPIFKGE